MVNDYLQIKNALAEDKGNDAAAAGRKMVETMGWQLAKHIKNGKADLNFSEFGSYSYRRQLSKLKVIENSIRDGIMPLPSYKLMHKNANLSKEDKSLIIDWAEKTKDSLSITNH